MGWKEKKRNERDWIDTGRLFGGVFDNVWFKESSLKERDLQDKLWMLEVVNNGNWTEQEFNLVWNYTSVSARERKVLFSSFHATNPLRWRSINPLRFIFYQLRSRDFEEKIEGLWTGYVFDSPSLPRKKVNKIYYDQLTNRTQLNCYHELELWP